MANARYISYSEQETKNIGKKIAAKLKGGEVLALSGELGAGKTVLAKGIAEGLGYRGIVNSPTFVLMKVYRITISHLLHKKKVGEIDGTQTIDGEKLEIRNWKFPPKADQSERTTNKRSIFNIKYICHIDAYRISDAREIVDIGVFEYLGVPQTVSLIEWPEKIKKILPNNTIWIELRYGKKDGERIIYV